jgi:hypothetical protein
MAIEFTLSGRPARADVPVVSENSAAPEAGTRAPKGAG